MSNQLVKLRNLLNPKVPTFSGEVTQVVNKTTFIVTPTGSNQGDVRCTSQTVYSVGDRVYFQGTTIVGTSPKGTLNFIEV